MLIVVDSSGVSEGSPTEASAGAHVMAHSASTTVDGEKGESGDDGAEVGTIRGDAKKQWDKRAKEQKETSSERDDKLYD